MVCLHLDECKESKEGRKRCYNPSSWKECKVYCSIYKLNDLLEILSNTQGFDGTIKDLKKMKDIDKLYELAEKDITIEFEVEVVNAKFGWGLSIRDAYFDFLNSEDKPEHDEQFFTGKWKEG